MNPKPNTLINNMKILEARFKADIERMLVTADNIIDMLEEWENSHEPKEE